MEFYLEYILDRNGQAYNYLFGALITDKRLAALFQTKELLVKVDAALYRDDVRELNCNFDYLKYNFNVLSAKGFTYYNTNSLYNKTVWNISIENHSYQTISKFVLTDNRNTDRLSLDYFYEKETSHIFEYKGNKYKLIFSVYDIENPDLNI